MPKANVIARTVENRLRKSVGLPFAPPLASARIERLLTQKAEKNAAVAKIKGELDVLNDKLLRGVKAEGAADPEGKVRLESGECNLQIIQAVNKTIDAKTLRALGVAQQVIDQATKETPYEYVGVWPKSEKGKSRGKGRK